MKIKELIGNVTGALSEVITETLGMATSLARTGRKGAEHFEEELDMEYQVEHTKSKQEYDKLLKELEAKTI